MSTSVAPPSPHDTLPPPQNPSPSKKIKNTPQTNDDDEKKEEDSTSDSTPTTPTPTPTSDSLANLPKPAPTTTIAPTIAPKPSPVLNRCIIMFSPNYVNSLTFLGNRRGDGSRTDPTPNRLTIHGDRDILLASLLNEYLLPPLQKMGLIVPVSPKMCNLNHMLKFHKKEYLDVLQNGPTNPSDLEDYNLVDDCALPETAEGRQQLFRYLQSMAGASLHAVAMLQKFSSGVKKTTTAINWGGGRHHAKANSAGGFCYVNDAVLALHGMRQKFGKTIYVDIDIHHCDGVEEAFENDDKVVTLSFHKYDMGFFPGTGESVGKKGKVNVPLPGGVTDDMFKLVFESGLERIITAHAEHSSPFSAFCLAVGADGLYGDPIVGLDGWSLSTRGLAESVRFVSLLCKRLKMPLLILGGGGYKDVNAARTFGVCTVAACEAGREGVLSRLPDRIPDHEYFPRYGPSFSIHTDETTKGDYGSEVGRRGRRVWAGVEVRHHEDEAQRGAKRRAGSSVFDVTM
ncbi:hypothetical protein TrLO_g6676 [Triparma laevis f. longispina]|uniref:Histone deacetylase domain-containing protein n=1 Tax=Triparma laevis f. longispina TaxID=1714387 RepID=A0A9W7C5Y8_9STRA|nr:hypothetical protein TrLO_g6676 [Triparma laevis f. longispina]